MTTSPSVTNYQIGKGVVEISIDAGVTFRDVGNASALEWTPAVTTLDHFSSRAGLKTKDKSVVIESGATLRMVMDEITGNNIGLLVLGTPAAADSSGDVDVKSMTLSTVAAVVRFTGANDVGPKMRFIGSVNFKPSGSFNLISDEWNTMEVTGEMVLDTNYGLGLFTVIG